LKRFRLSPDSACEWCSAYVYVSYVHVSRDFTVHVSGVLRMYIRMCVLHVSRDFTVHVSGVLRMYVHMCVLRVSRDSTVHVSGVLRMYICVCYVSQETLQYMTVVVHYVSWYLGKNWTYQKNWYT
jgi:hypothetical protein